MTRRKALTIAVSVAGLSCLIFVLLLLSKPVPAISHAGYAWVPGCHCGKPAAAAPKATTTTTAKKTTPTTAKTTTTTAKKATTTVTSGTQAATTTTGNTTSAQTTTTKSTTGKTSTKTKSTKRSTTTTGAQSDGQSGSDQGGTLALGAAVASFPGGGDGGSPGGSGSPDGTGLAGGEPVAAQMSSLPHYYVSPVAIAFLLVYGVSFALYRTKRLRVATHRKIWNVLLMATFLLCGILGLVLAVGITRTPPWELPTWLIVWHVETGIAMSFISVFHIGWHLRYYLAIVTGKRRAARAGARAEKVPAVERGAARERIRRPQVARPSAVRTEAERMRAFEQRMAGRVDVDVAAQARAVRRAPASSDADRWVEEARRRVAPAS
jgi:hypothetical protein